MNRSAFGFGDQELEALAEILAARYGRAVDFEIASAELQLDPAPAPAVACAAVYWESHGAQFVVCKAGGARFQGAFFDAEGRMPGAPREHSEIGDCVTALLRAHSDHELP
ncbi:MAG: hypothetical protein ACXWG6_11575 [Usitatibacter sp.]